MKINPELSVILSASITMAIAVMLTSLTCDILHITSFTGFILVFVMSSAISFFFVSGIIILIHKIKNKQNGANKNQTTRV